MTRHIYDPHCATHAMYMYIAIGSAMGRVYAVMSEHASLPTNHSAIRHSCRNYSVPTCTCTCTHSPSSRSIRALLIAVPPPLPSPGARRRPLPLPHLAVAAHELQALLLRGQGRPAPDGAHHQAGDHQSTVDAAVIVTGRRQL